MLIKHSISNNELRTFHTLFCSILKNDMLLRHFSHVRLCDPMDCSPPGSSVHGILQARILEWVAIPFSRRSSQLRYWTQVYLHARRILYHLSHQGIPKPLHSKCYNESWSQRTRAQLERPFHEKAMMELPAWYWPRRAGIESEELSSVPGSAVIQATQWRA